MEWRKLTVENLSNKTGIPEKTISRMRTNEKYNPSLAYIALCCIAMELMSWDCDRLVELAGYYLRIENDEERCYKGCLSGGLASSGDFDLCDNLFVTNGFKPLTSIVSLNRNRNQIN